MAKTAPTTSTSLVSSSACRCTPPATTKWSASEVPLTITEAPLPSEIVSNSISDEPSPSSVSPRCERAPSEIEPACPLPLQCDELEQIGVRDRGAFARFALDQDHVSVPAHAHAFAEVDRHGRGVWVECARSRQCSLRRE